MVLVTDGPMVGALSWWVSLDLSHLKWAGTVDSIIVVAALVEGPALLVTITVVFLVTHGPMVGALSIHDTRFLNLGEVLVLEEELLLGVSLLLFVHSSLDGDLSWTFASWTFHLEESTTGWWSGLDLSHLEWAGAIDGIIPVAPMIESPALLKDITIVILITWVPVVVTLSGHDARFGKEVLFSWSSSSEGYK